MTAFLFENFLHKCVTMDALPSLINGGDTIMDFIEARNITKIYSTGSEKVKALDDVSLLVTRGEFISITGASGCGKSTLLHVIGGLCKPTSGEIFLDGKSLYKRKSAELAMLRRSEIGVIYQFYNLVPELTAEENLILPALMSGSKVERDRVEKIWDILGMKEKKQFYPSQLSGGQQQKIAIGRAIVNMPSLLLADEPTGNLDTKKRDELLELFRYLNQTCKITILLITHDKSVAECAGRRICLSDGRIVRDEVTG